MQNKIIVVGIGPGNKNYITPAALEKIQSAKFLVGGRRALADFSTSSQETFAITADLNAVKNFIAEKILLDNVVVMVSGDPGYFSLLTYLKKNFTTEIEVIPSISAMQLAFAKLALSWVKFEVGKVLGLLTDSVFNSVTISEILLNLGWETNSNIAIFSRLSYPDEKITVTTLESAIKSDAVKHCILIVGF